MRAMLTAVKNTDGFGGMSSELKIADCMWFVWALGLSLSALHETAGDIIECILKRERVVCKLHSSGWPGLQPCAHRTHIAKSGRDH